MSQPVAGAGIRDILLFRSFVPENDGEYVGAIVLFIVTGIIASGLRVWRSVREAAERIERNKVLHRYCFVVMHEPIFSTLHCSFFVYGSPLLFFFLVFDSVVS